MNTLEIPKGFELDLENSTKNSIVLRKKTLPTTFSDLGIISGYKETGEGTAQTCTNVPASDAFDAIIYPSIELLDATNALMKLIHLRDVYNGDWIPNWKNTNEFKYCIIFIKGDVITEVFTGSQHILYFRTKALSEDFLKNFKGLIEIAKPLL